MNPIATILLVDDVPANRDTLLELLDAKDYRLVEAASGPEALKLAAESPPDLVLLDVMMPGMDGYEVCRRLRADARLAEVPVIMITALDDQAARLAGIEAGADDFITKPFHSVELRARVRTITRLNRYRRLTEAAERIREQAALLDHLLEHSPAVLYSLKVKGEQVVPYLVSENITRLLGFTVAESCSFDWWVTQLNPEDRERALASIPETLERGALTLEYRIRHKEGHFVWVEDNQRTVCDATGKPVEIAGVWTDIAERKREEAQRLESERRFREMLENVNLIAMTLDKNGTVTFCNDYLLQLTGWTREEIIGADWFEKFIPEANPEIKSVFFDTINVGKIPRHYENAIKTREGELREIVWNNTMLRDVAGNIIGTASIGDDVTERRRGEAELERTHRELLESSRQAGMAEVATSVLHNVGNVLNSVNVASTCLADSLRKSKAANLSKVVAMLREHEADMGAFINTDPKGKMIPGYLSQLAEHLSGEQAAAIKELAQLQKNIEHIKDIVSMQQSGAKVSGVTERVKATDLVEDALRMNASSLSHRNIEILKEFEEVPPVMTQKQKVVQILVNLIRNATQACDDSGHSNNQLTLRVRRSQNGVSLSVSDNAVGISPENLTRIFAHGFTTKKDGHGFGLHGAALAAKELGGSLSVRSDGVGHGATFVVELPLEQPGRNATPSHEPCASHAEPETNPAPNGKVEVAP